MSIQNIEYSLVVFIFYSQTSCNYVHGGIIMTTRNDKALMAIWPNKSDGALDTSLINVNYHVLHGVY